MWSESCYDIGGHLYSILDIKHVILGWSTNAARESNSVIDSFLLSKLVVKMEPGDPRLRARVKKPDDRFEFAIHTGNMLFIPMLHYPQHITNILMNMVLITFPVSCVRVPV